MCVCVCVCVIPEVDSDLIQREGLDTIPVAKTRQIHSVPLAGDFMFLGTFLLAVGEGGRRNRRQQNICTRSAGLLHG